MAWKIQRREYHARRLVRRGLRNHILPFHGLRVSDVLFNSRPDFLLITSSPKFSGAQQASEWARAQQKGTHFKLSIRRDFVRADLHALNYVFRQPTVTWDIQEEDQRQRRKEYRVRREEGAFQGNVKPHRRKYHQLRRAAGKRAEHLALRGEIDLAESVPLNVGTKGITWDVW